MAHVQQVPDVFDWQPQPDAAAFLEEILQEFCRRSLAIGSLSARLRDETGTRLIDWVDSMVLPPGNDLDGRLADLGFARDAIEPAWRHPAGLFPPLEIAGPSPPRLVLRVESVADFLAAHRLDARVPIEGPPLGELRKSRIEIQEGLELWVVERHGCRGWQPPERSFARVEAGLMHAERFRLRQRRFEQPQQGFEHARTLVRNAVEDLGGGWAADLFFAAEREYWSRRNRAARVQKDRQDRLGMGWANHDHHTYRSSREHFASLIAVLEELGLTCRERFYAGEQAGWGAQVLENPGGIVVFADVDLSPEEVAGDFAHQPLPPRHQLGTVGLWCRLHGEAFLEAGMHHLECRFDFEAARRQLAEAGIATMAPFTDLPYLKQAFTEGERWPVDPQRIEAAAASGHITTAHAEQFARCGALGSHLEILQRDDGYRGFNKEGISQIIRGTDPRHQAERPLDG